MRVSVCLRAMLVCACGFLLWQWAQPLLMEALLEPVPEGTTLHGGSTVWYYLQANTWVLLCLVPSLVVGLLIGWLLDSKAVFWAAGTCGAAVLFLILSHSYVIGGYGEPGWVQRALPRYAANTLCGAAGGFLGALFAQRALGGIRKRKKGGQGGASDASTI